MSGGTTVPLPPRTIHCPQPLGGWGRQSAPLSRPLGPRPPSPLTQRGGTQPPQSARWGDPQGCIRREGTPEAAPGAVRQAVGGGGQSGWGRLLSVTNAIEAGTCRQGDTCWASAGRPGGGRGGLPPFQCIPGAPPPQSARAPPPPPAHVRTPGGTMRRTPSASRAPPPPPRAHGNSPERRPHSGAAPAPPPQSPRVLCIRAKRRGPTQYLEQRRCAEAPGAPLPRGLPPAHLPDPRPHTSAPRHQTARLTRPLPPKIRLEPTAEGTALVPLPLGDHPVAFSEHRRPFAVGGMRPEEGGGCLFYLRVSICFSTERRLWYH